VTSASGEYRIAVRADDKGAPAGRYAIAFQERRAALPADDGRVSAQRASADGTRAFAEKNFVRAREKYQEALAIYRQSHRRVEEAATLTAIARTAVSVSDFETALQRFAEALSIYRESGDVHGQGITEYELGNIYFNTSRYDDARRHYEQALDARRTAGYHAGEGMALRGLGSAYSSMSQQEKALDLYEQALAISRAEKARTEEARALNSLGIANSLLGRQEKAIEYFTAALAITRELGDRSLEANTLGNLGVAHQGLSRYDEAVQYYEQLLTTSRELNDRTGEARALNNLGHISISRSRYQAAVEYFDQSLTLYREVQNRNGQGMALGNLGNTYFWLSAFDKAISFSEQALAIFREIKNRIEEGRMLNNLGDTYDALGKHETAVDYYEQALTIARAVKRPTAEARALASLGIAYNALGRYEDALRTNEQALAIFREVKDVADEAATLVALGEVHNAMHEYDRAIDRYQQALPLVRAVNNRTGEGLTLGDLMLAHQRSGDAAVAIFFGKQAVNAFQRVRGDLTALEKTFQESYLTSHEDTYRTLADLLISAGRLAEAEKVLELLKDEEFNRAIHRDGPGSTVGLTKGEAEAAGINDQLATLALERGPLLAKIANKSATDRDRQRLDVVEAAIVDANKRVKRVLAEVASAADGDALVTQQSQSMMQSLRRLGDGTVALYTVVANGTGWVILTTPDFRRAYPIKAADLNKTIGNFRRALTSDRLDAVPLAQALYRALFLQKNEQGSTLARDLEAYHAKTLMWSLDGVLRYVPISALHDGRRYLAERFPDVVFTTASLTRLLDPTDANWRAFGLGVSKPHGDFPALPSVRRELRSIIRDPVSAEVRGVLPGVIRLDEQFTRRAMLDGLREGYPVVHIASHFSFNPAKEETSFLLLGDGSYFSVEEMQNSPGIFERVELLTLSACDTASVGANGKEVESMAYVAQDLGAKAVVASLWPVADVGTEVLMREFYRLRQANPRWSKAEALRRAQMALLRGTPYAHPHYWASFILIGNWR
jgi:CHAT domain-containing protein/Flp pilus assembly protein TadD